MNHCLEKNSAARFHSASDLMFALEALGRSAPVSGETVTTITDGTDPRASGQTIAMDADCIIGAGADSRTPVCYRLSGVPQQVERVLKLTLLPPENVKAQVEVPSK